MLDYLSISKVQFAVVVALALVAGVSNTLLVVTVTSGVKSTTTLSPEGLLLSFAVVFLVYVGSQYSALRMITVTTERSLRQMREQNMRKLLGARQTFLEQYGHEKIVAHLTKDLPNMNSAVPVMVNSVIGGITILSALVYLAYVSGLALIYAIVIIAIGTYLYARVSDSAKQKLLDARRTEDFFLRHVTHLVKGSKELKLNSPRAQAFYQEDVVNNIGHCYANSVVAKLRFTLAGQIGNSLFFLLIGLVAVAPTMLPMLDAADKVTYVIVLVFLMGPISRVVLSIPSLYETLVSYNKVREFDDKLSAAQENFNEKSGSPDVVQWREIRFFGVTYQYDDDEKYPFTLGPIDLTIRRGETLFIVGGNGSGKSTLGKILTGLYMPDGGHIEVEGKRLESADYSAYRQIFTSVFSDYHLFDKLHGIDEKMLDGELQEILDKLQLPNAIIDSGKYMRVNELSQGQRKRLALATSYFENKDVLFFDEWAADQDPVFKAYFYNQLLAELKRSGKTVVAITHDDFYADVADRVIRMRNGALICDPEETTV